MTCGDKKLRSRAAIEEKPGNPFQDVNPTAPFRL
jgi:hypothetical protein